MYLKSFILLICSCFSFYVFGQVEGIRLTSTLADTLAIQEYIEATDRLTHKSPDSAVERYLYAADMAIRINYNAAIVHCLLKAGDYYFNKQKNYRRSMHVLNEAVPYAKKIEERRHYSLIPRLYNLLGGSLFYTGNYDSAIHYYLLGIQVIDSLDLEQDQLYISIHGNLGSTLAVSRQYRQGAIYIQKAIDLLQRQAQRTLDNQDSITLAVAYGNMGSLYANFFNKPDSAQYWWRQAAALYKLTGNKAALQGVYANMGGGWLVDDQLDVAKARKYLDSALIIDPQKAENDGMLQIALGRLYYHTGHFTRAIRHCQRALVLCENTGTRERKLVSYETLSFCYAFLGDSKQCQKYRLLNKLLSDSLYNERVDYAISEAETQYRVAEKNKTLAEKQAALYHQRYLLTGSISLSLTLVFLLAGIIRNNRHKRRLHQEQVQNLKQQNTIEQMQVKINAEEQERKRIARELHDSLGTLISATKISQKLLAKTLPQAVDTKPFMESHQLLNQMQEEVGVITNNLIPNYITQHGLESALQTLVTRFHRPEIFEIQIHSFGPVKELHPDRTFTLYRVIEEIMHNAVKHSGGTRLTIQLMYHEEQLHISIEDNGSGFDVDNQHTGMGLQNIRSRVHSLNGHLHLSAKEGKGTSYMLEIPY